MEKENLLNYAYNKHSQAGQDGILENIFNKLEIKNGNFSEFGSRDGVKGSNCRKLFEEGWSGVFIEIDKKGYEELLENYKDVENVVCLNKGVSITGESTFDRIIEKHAPEMDFDLISIDIDGPDLEVFESIEKYLPKVVVLEGGKGPHPFEDRVPSWATANTGQSLKVIDGIARKKGYRIVCSYQDTILVKEEYFEKVNSISDLKELYVNGYLAQTLSNIALYKSRLEMNGRRNKILEYLLKETNFYDYCKNTKKSSNKHPETIKWMTENKELIEERLNSIPDNLYEVKENKIIKLVKMFAYLIKSKLRKLVR